MQVLLGLNCKSFSLVYVCVNMRENITQKKRLNALRVRSKYVEGLINFF